MCGHFRMKIKIYYIILLTVLVVTCIYLLLGRPKNFSDISIPSRCDHSQGDHIYCTAFFSIDFWLHPEWKFVNYKLFEI